MDTMTWAQATKYIRDFNRRHNIAPGVTDPSCTIAVVFTPDSFDKPYSLESRTYLVNNLNKAFLPNMGGYSIFSNCLDDTDPCVRLERYIEDEGRGGDWKVDYCYIYFEGTEEDLKRYK